MPGSSNGGLHSTRLGLKQTGSDPVDYMTNLISGSTTFDPPSWPQSLEPYQAESP